MPAATAIALGTLALGTTQMIMGKKKEREAQEATDEAVKQMRKTIEEGQANKLSALQVPTIGTELQERALARATAGGIEAAQEAGAAGVIGGVPRMVQATGEQAAAQAAEIDKMQKERDKLVLTQEQVLESQRYQGLLGLQQMELTGAQQAVSDALAQQQAGLQTVVSAGDTYVTSQASKKNPYGNQKTTSNSNQNYYKDYEMPKSVSEKKGN